MLVVVGVSSKIEYDCAPYLPESIMVLAVSGRAMSVSCVRSDVE
jgi:hypothetical protein